MELEKRFSKEMQKNMIEENESYNGERNTFVIEFSHTSKARHIRIAISKYWRNGFVSGGVTLASAIAVIEFILNRFSIELSKLALLAFLIAAPILIAIIFIAISYYNHVPSGFEDESREIQKIVHFKRMKWETRLAIGLLREKLDKTEMQINDIVDDMVHIPITSRPEVDEYLNWLQTRPSNLLRMIEVAKNLLIRDFAGALTLNDKDAPDPKKILESVNKVKKLFDSTYEFGLEGRSIQAPDGFERIHEIQGSWVKIIQDTILQVYDFLEIVLKHDIEEEKRIQFAFVFDSPTNIEEYIDELRRLEGNI